MNILIEILIILILLGLLFALCMHFELKKFCTNTFEIMDSRIAEEIRFAVVSDLHNHVFGKENEPLFQAIEDIHPDAILIPGDLLTQDKKSRTDLALAFLKNASAIAPVYYSNGNHETRLQKTAEGKRTWEEFEAKAKEYGVHFVNNASETVTMKNTDFQIAGFEADMKYYAKGREVPMPKEEVAEEVAVALRKNMDSFRILLAHNPIYFEAYRYYGADLTLSGHMHGGLVRIPGLGSVISPQFKLFPKYDAGHFCEDGKHLLISRGLGTHTFHIRVFNRAELIDLRLKPTQK